MELASRSWRSYLSQNWKRILRDFTIFAVVSYLAFWVYLFLFVGPPQEHLFSYVVTPGAFIVIVILAVIPVWEFLGAPKSVKEESEQES
ncbi:MAG: hypothetical protein ACFFER_12700 [Candidatus Thorarchaeota archaeon]